MGGRAESARRKFKAVQHGRGAIRFLGEGGKLEGTKKERFFFRREGVLRRINLDWKRGELLENRPRTEESRGGGKNCVSVSKRF